MLASDIFGDVRKTTLDGAARAYSNADLASFLTEALCSLANDKTDAYTITTDHDLVAGESQSLPDDGVALFDVPNNTVANGGRIVTMVQRELLAEASRFWPAGTRQAQVEHYTYDPRTARQFKVFPPNNGNGAVQIIYGAVPPAITAPTDELVVSDTYRAPLTNYVTAKCYAVNGKKADVAKFNNYMTLYRGQLGLRTTSIRATAPKIADVGETS